MLLVFIFILKFLARTNIFNYRSIRNDTMLYRKVHGTVDPQSKIMIWILGNQCEQISRKRCWEMWSKLSSEKTFDFNVMREEISKSERMSWPPELSELMNINRENQPVTRCNRKISFVPFRREEHIEDPLSCWFHQINCSHLLIKEIGKNWIYEFYIHHFV